MRNWDMIPKAEEKGKTRAASRVDLRCLFHFYILFVCVPPSLPRIRCFFSHSSFASDYLVHAPPSAPILIPWSYSPSMCLTEEFSPRRLAHQPPKLCTIIKNTIVPRLQHTDDGLKQRSETHSLHWWKRKAIKDTSLQSTASKRWKEDNFTLCSFATLLHSIWRMLLATTSKMNAQQ